MNIGALVNCEPFEVNRSIIARPSKSTVILLDNQSTSSEKTENSRTNHYYPLQRLQDYTVSGAQNIPQKLNIRYIVFVNNAFIYIQLFGRRNFHNTTFFSYKLCMQD